MIQSESFYIFLVKITLNNISTFLKFKYHNNNDTLINKQNAKKLNYSNL